ncbi:TetR/AcrR family transcriptional regulator [Geodermatophilus sabuli]|uniref:TetR/AcrR family transcriptional regulator n=1 Tax=Geodermatophilus sabuli TaxID=1564158 RepID=A0A7K3VV32_9ACTN|nr:TetR/AcrR family transcriptional regulator [Geodermatophilus sabuli]NEK56486.1 TetR/AcrR family transcriptional regulator [Geodermatophilus sabuli]
MAQVLKPAVRARIETAALRCFADRGYGRTSMAEIAAAAGTAPANVYRYFASKEALFAAVVPADLPARHDRLLDTRVAALAEGRAHGPAAAELLDFWLDQRLAVVVLLDRAEGTPVAGCPDAFVRRLVEHAERSLPAPPSAVHREVLVLVFDNTRRALAHILRTAEDREQARAMIAAFWSYQLPGLDGLMAALRAAARDGSGSSPTAADGVGGAT